MRTSDVTTAGPDGPRAGPALPETGPAGARFPADLMVAAATLYYLQDATQAEIARRLGTSRASVSRLLSEARRLGIVRIEVVPPVAADDEGLAERTAEALGLQAVHLAPPAAPGRAVGAALAAPLGVALTEVGLHPGDVLLISSGRTVYEAAQTDLPALPGVVVVPTVGGQEEPEAWYQTNEIVREIAAKVGGRPAFLYAPALPGPELFRILVEEPSIRRVLELWRTARCAVLGVGAAPVTRQSISAFVPTDAVSLRQAVADVCLRFYDRDGHEVPFPGSDRLIATALDVLREVPVGIAVACGPEKVAGIAAGARAGYFNRLVTDTSTAVELIAYADRQAPADQRRARGRRSTD